MYFIIKINAFIEIAFSHMYILILKQFLNALWKNRNKCYTKKNLLKEDK